ncbi:hypothetical protein FHG87_023339 [Trinorchestia longiramus]|nr:hypothetical protein FHG87_023339 [Trinorchestia longiramus]
MKTKDWIAHPRSKSKKELGDQVIGRWKVNIFFLLLVSSQSLILPWLPAILQASGLRGLGIGVVMALITLASVLSVKIVLIFITATKSGALRRFILLFLLGTACVMYVIAIAALPFDKSYNKCSSDPVPDDLNVSNATLPTSTAAGNTIPAPVANSSDSTTAISSSPPSATKRPSEVENFKNNSQVDITGSKNSTVFTKPLITTTFTPRTTTTPTTTTTKSSASKNTAFVDSSISGSPANEPSSDWFTFVLNTTDSMIPDTEEPIESLSNNGYNQSGNNKGSDLTLFNSIDQKENILSSGTKPTGNTGSHTWFNSNPLLTDVTALKPNLLGTGSLGRRKSPKESFSGISSSRSDLYNDNLPFQILDPSYRQHKMQNEPMRSSYDHTFGQYSQYNDEHNIIKRHYREKENAKDKGENAQHSLEVDSDLEQKLHKELKDGESFDLNSENIEKLKEILMEAESKTVSTESPKHAHESGSWIWVSIFLISASLMAGGIEAGVTRLWHCYNHCYHLFHNRPRQDVNSDDLLERTLTDTFELSANGEHYGWTRILSGCVIIVSSVLLAFGCQIGLPPGWSLVGQAGVFTMCAIFTITVLLLLLPVPWGSIKPPKFVTE